MNNPSEPQDNAEDKQYLSDVPETNQPYYKPPAQAGGTFPSFTPPAHYSQAGQNLGNAALSQAQTPVPDYATPGASKLARLALIFSLVPFVLNFIPYLNLLGGLLVIAGLVLGIISIRREKPVRGMAIAAVIVSSVVLLLNIVVITLLLVIITGAAASGII